MAEGKINNAIHQSARMGRYKNLKWDKDTMMMDYLDALAQYGHLGRAADVVGCDPREIRYARRDDPHFDALCVAAMEKFNAHIHEIAYDRAVNGVQVPIIGGRFRDEVVAFETRYSDSLLRAFLLKTNPEFAETKKIEVSGGIELVQTFEYSSFSKDIRAKLREILVILIAERRGQEELRKALRSAGHQLGAAQETVVDAESWSIDDLPPDESPG
jgi:hypothetical protein